MFTGFKICALNMCFVAKIFIFISACVGCVVSSVGVSTKYTKYNEIYITSSMWC